MTLAEMQNIEFSDYLNDVIKSSLKGLLLSLKYLVHTSTFHICKMKKVAEKS